MKKTAILGALAVALSAAATCAHAQTLPGYELKLTGTASGIDNLGFFGPPGANLTGEKFTEILFVNTDRGSVSTSLDYQSISGSNSNDAVVAEVSVNGGPILMLGNVYPVSSTNASVYNDGVSSDLYASVYTYVRGYSTILQYDYHGVTGDAGFPTRFGQSTTVNVQPYSDYENGFTVYGSSGFVAENIDLNATVFSAPEPSMWLLMLGGVGALGIAFRSSKAQRSRAPAEAC